MVFVRFLIASAIVSAAAAAVWVAPHSSVKPEFILAPVATDQAAATAAQPLPVQPPVASPAVNPSTGTRASAAPANTKPVVIEPSVVRSPMARAVQRTRMDARRMSSDAATSIPAPAVYQAQGDPPAVQRRPTELIMLAGGSFDGDLRTLRQTPVRQRERPEREGPEPNPVLFSPPGGGTVSSPDPTTAAPVRAAPAPATTVNFEGLNKNSWGAGWPPDSNIDVGPNHIIESVNVSLGIYTKAGALTAAFTFDEFMSLGNFGNVCDTDNYGDPVVLYDTFEDRWVISDFAFQLDGSDNIENPPGAFECFAVSKTSDPVLGGWNFYSINTAGGFGDYPKLGIWPDGLYVSFNMFDYSATGGFQNVRLYALNKAQMYAGAAMVQVVSFDLPTSEFSLLPANARLQTGTPPAGSPNYVTSVWNFSNVISTWKFHVDWAHVALSTLTGPTNTIAPAYTSYAAADGRVPTSANAVDTLWPRLMMQNQYSNIGGIESIWNSHTVGTSGVPPPGQASVRFYQVQVTGGAIEANATQAFTHSPDALHRFMPSVAVNKRGDMAIGYNVTDSGMHPAIRYAGRLVGDSPNTLPQTETSLIEGGGSQTRTNRWGDYATMTLDPDGCTFWLIGEYYQSTGDETISNWNTRVGAFTFAGCTPDTTGTLTGTVKNAASIPIPNAIVKLGVRTAMTNASGEYSFTGLPDGTYPSATAGAQGFNSSTVTDITVPGGGSVVRNFTLTSPVSSGCFIDTTQLDFQGDVAAINCDFNTSPGSVVLARSVVLDQQNTEVNNSGTIFGNTGGAAHWSGQTFTAAVTGPLTREDLQMLCAGCSGAVNPDITVAIRATSANVPTGGDLATGTIPGFNTSVVTWYTVNFASPPTVTAGTKYAVIVRLTVPRPQFQLYANTCSCNDGVNADFNPYANGQHVSSTSTGATWTLDNLGGGRDLAFKVYVQPPYEPGTFTSSLKDANPVAGGTAIWGTISWNASVPGGTGLTFQVAGSNSPTGPFTFVGPDGTPATFFSSGGSLAQFNGKRYLRYQAQLTSEGANTPAIHDVTICFSTTPRPLLDLNGDGTGDVFTYGASTGVWKWQVSQGNGTFVETGASSDLFNWSSGWAVVPARFNDDNHTDFFLFNPSNGNWYKMLNDGVSGFTEAANGSWFNGWQRFVMDLDGDEISDVFLYDPVTGVWFKCVSTPTGFNYIQGGWNPGWEITLLTLNGDALGDMFLFNRTDGRWFWVLGDAGASFTYPATSGWSTGWNLYPGDFNADGLSDLLLHDPLSGVWFVAMNDGLGTGFTYTTGQWALGWTPYMGDLDADGDQDLFLHKPSNGAWFQLLSDGVGGFTEGGGQQWTTGWDIYLTDLNADNRTDVLLYNPSTGVWYQALNFTLGTFTYTAGGWQTNLTIIVRTPFM